MRGLGILVAGAVVLALAMGGTVAAETVTVSPGPPLAAELTISPKTLPRREPAPAALAFGLRVLPTLDGVVHPLREVAIELDRNVVLDLRGFPECDRAPSYERITVANTSRECGTSTVATGSAAFEIRFPDYEPVSQSAPLIVVNGGRKGNLRTLFAITEIAVPVPTTIVITIEIRPIEQGRSGTRATISLPRVAGGSGALTQLRFRIAKRYLRDGRPASLVRARCPDGKLQSQVDLQFAEGASYGTELVRPCAGRDD